MNVVGERVYERRRALKLTQDGLCARLAAVTAGAWNPDRRDIFRIEDGRRSVYDTELLALGEALEVSASWLLSEVGDRPQRRS
jgi:hypothetical protein